MAGRVKVFCFKVWFSDMFMLIYIHSTYIFARAQKNFGLFRYTLIITQRSSTDCTDPTYIDQYPMLKIWYPVLFCLYLGSPIPHILAPWYRIVLPISWLPISIDVTFHLSTSSLLCNIQGLRYRQNNTGYHILRIGYERKPKSYSCVFLRHPVPPPVLFCESWSEWPIIYG